ncbi:MAG: AzlC family ABC transporter permease [Spirochaetaceae bacterium]|nr:AzlC family ABC transporter permease [Spirochaetaceae bacterium]
MNTSTQKIFLEGMRDGTPIGLGYFAVSFSLGIFAKRVGFNAFQGFLASILNLASAGEYALFECAQGNAGLIETAFVIFVVNARYMLMGCALSQKFNRDTPFFHRFLVGFPLSDEIFGIAIARENYTPAYSYGAACIAAPLWAIGTAAGVLAGNLLPDFVVNALSMSLYGMFLAIIVPPAKKDKTLAVAILASFAASFAFSVLPLLKLLSSGMKTIILTVAISAILAAVKPVYEETK